MQRVESGIFGWRASFDCCCSWAGGPRRWPEEMTMCGAKVWGGYAGSALLAAMVLFGCGSSRAATGSSLAGLAPGTDVNGDGQVHGARAGEAGTTCQLPAWPGCHGTKVIWPAAGACGAPETKMLGLVGWRCFVDEQTDCPVERFDNGCGSFQKCQPGCGAPVVCGDGIESYLDLNADGIDISTSPGAILHVFVHFRVPGDQSVTLQYGAGSAWQDLWSVAPTGAAIVDAKADMAISTSFLSKVDHGHFRWGGIGKSSLGAAGLDVVAMNLEQCP